MSTNHPIPSVRERGRMDRPLTALAALAAILTIPAGVTLATLFYTYVIR